MIDKLKQLINEASQQTLLKFLIEWLYPTKIAKSINFYKRGVTPSPYYYVYHNLKEVVNEFYPGVNIISLINKIWKDFYKRKVLELGRDISVNEPPDFFSEETFEILSRNTKDEKWKKKIRTAWKLFLHSKMFEDVVYNSKIMMRYKKYLPDYEINNLEDKRENQFDEPY